MSTATTHIKTEKKLTSALRFNEFEGVYKNFGFNELIIKANQGVNTTTEKVKYSESGITVIKSNNIGENVIDFSGVNYVDVETFERLNSNCKPEKGDILYCNIGSALGSAAIFDTKEKVLINWNVYRIQYKKDVINDVLFCQLLNLKKRTIMRYATLSTMPFISSKAFRHIYFNIPELPEQQKIASFLSAVDEKIQQLTKKKALLEQYKKGVMQQLFSGQLRFKDENGKEYPDWEEKRLLEFCTFFSGGTPSSTNKKFYSGTIPFIGSGNIYDSEVFNFISEEALNSSSAKIVEEGDLLYALYGANSGEVAISQLEGAINQAILCIRTKESIEYLYYLLLGNKDNIVAKYLQGGQGNLSAQIIKKLKYKFPSIEEQQKIATYLSRIDTKIESVNNQITQTQTFKKGLLQQLFV
jgi:type I restriction enzyme S subunit